MGLLKVRKGGILAAMATCAFTACLEREYDNPLLAGDTSKDSAGVHPKDPIDLTIRVARVSGSDLTLEAGEKAAPEIAIHPPDAADRRYSLASDKPEVARVEGREILAVKKGGAEITVTTEDGAKTDVFKVKVEEVGDD